MDKKLVIGLGSGRCGTVSLRELLIHQGFNAVHELKLMPWDPNYPLCDEVIAEVLKRNGGLVSDIGYYYLNYTEYIISKQPGVKFVCLKRNKEEVIRSFLKFSKYDYWSYPYVDREETEWDATFPTYYNVGKTSGISLYWDEYDKISKSLEIRFPKHFKVFDMNETLNEEEGQRKLFEFIDIEGDIKLGIKRHTNPPDRPFKYV